MKKFAIVITMILLLPCISFAHSGGTDENGGHYNRSTGSYHYHHGYPAHSHENGCPYSYKNNTDDHYTPSNKKSNTKSKEQKEKALIWRVFDRFPFLSSLALMFLINVAFLGFLFFIMR